MKKQFKIGLLASFASAGAMAAPACAGSAGNSTAVPGDTNGTLFVRVGFSPKCSANVLLDYTDSHVVGGRWRLNKGQEHFHR